MYHTVAPVDTNIDIGNGKVLEILRVDNYVATWAGNAENLKSPYRIPIFVRHDDDKVPGNLALIEKGCIPISSEELLSMDDLRVGLEGKLAESDYNSEVEKPGHKSSQLDLFS